MTSSSCRVARRGTAAPWARAEIRAVETETLEVVEPRGWIKDSVAESAPVVQVAPGANR